MKFLFNIFKIFLFYSFLLTSINAEIIEKIFINGNKRISDKTIQMFANIEIKDEISNKRLNLILKDLYDTNYFEDVSISFENKILTIFVKENPIVQKINYKGVKSKTLLESIIADKLIREKSSYNLIILQDEKNRLNKIVKDMGYFNTEIQISVEKFLLGNHLRGSQRNNVENIIYIAHKFVSGEIINEVTWNKKKLIERNFFERFFNFFN